VTEALLILTPLLPLGIAAAVAARIVWSESPPGASAGPQGGWAAPLGALPALLLALHPGPVPDLHLSWMLLGTYLGLDHVGRVFLVLTAVLWMLAGLFARAYMSGDSRRARYDTFFLLTMSGNFTVVIAQDLATFYAGFATVTFAAYGLVVHAGSEAARRAGRVYIVLALAGEAALLSGLFLVAVAAGGGLGLDGVPAAVAHAPFRDTVVALLLVGFGVKAGVLLLHVWLPLAHPVAPTPASAVLSGAIIKAGVLGWLRFLPLGEAALPTAGTAVIAAGLLAAFAAAAVGITQRDAKTALAYSSVSQMGLLTVAVGVGLAHPDAWPLASGALLVSALHHAMAKGALFLATGIGAPSEPAPWVRHSFAIGVGIPMAALAGAPWTSGALAKAMLKEAADLAPGRWPQVLDLGLPLAAVGTTVLMARFAVLVWRAGDHSRGAARSTGLWVPWLASVLASGGLVVAASGPLGLTADARQVTFADTLWPIGVGVAVSALLALAEARSRALPVVPAGDVLVWYAAALDWSSRSAPRALAEVRCLITAAMRGPWERVVEFGRVRMYWLRAMTTPASLAAAGTAWLLATVVILAALWFGASRVW
jgi:formate hydrogenlyase subunit 3/multisubunit Na+/H+ antiporter MnhD subunit